MKIGLVADIHAGPDADTQLGSNAPALLDTFCEAMRAFRPDLILDLGDRVNPVSREHDLERTAWVRRQLLRAGVPVYHVIGNTDVANLTNAELLPALEKGAGYEHQDTWDPRLILLDSEDPPFERVGGEIGERQLAWLSGILEHDARPALVFCHHPLDDQDLSGHRYFTGRRNRASVVNRGRVRALLARGRVLASFAGHMHWSRATVLNGVPHVTLGSLVDNAYTDGRSSGTFAEVSVADQRVEVRIGGLRPEHWHFTP